VAPVEPATQVRHHEDVFLPGGHRVPALREKRREGLDMALHGSGTQALCRQKFGQGLGVHGFSLAGQTAGWRARPDYAEAATLQPTSYASDPQHRAIGSA
jgi:hypothetical protein